MTTLDVVDVATGWTECRMVWGKGQERVGGALDQVKTHAPVPLARTPHRQRRGVSQRGRLSVVPTGTRLQLTWGRPYRKNDQAFVEQKNWSVVRRLVGYDRYSTKSAAQAFERLYRDPPWVNFFQPLRKVVSKERVGAKVTKRYDVAQTPYQRILADRVESDDQAAALRAEFSALNPIRLRAEIDAALDALWSQADRRDPLSADSPSASDGRATTIEQRASAAEDKGRLHDSPARPSRKMCGGILSIFGNRFY